MTRHDRPGARPPAGAGPLIAGHRWYRTRIRVFGPLLGLVPMALLGGAAKLVLHSGEGRTSGLLGLVTGVAAAPGMLLAGAPFADPDRYRPAALASVPLWLLLGLIASRRATVPTIASWRDYWREMFWLTIAVVVGAVAALFAAALMLGESLVV